MENYTKPISQEEWDKAYDNRETLYVNYQYHKDVCAKSLERVATITHLESQQKHDLDKLAKAEKSNKQYLKDIMVLLNVCKKPIGQYITKKESRVMEKYTLLKGDTL